jgi:CRP/FNR family transcriptional regulator
MCCGPKKKYNMQIKMGKMNFRQLEILARAPLFNGLPKDQMEKLGTIMEVREVEKGTVIFSDGDDANGFYVVAEGTVKIYKLSPDGKEKILHIFGPPEPFGEVPVFAGTKFPANAQSTSKSTLFFFPRGVFVALLTETPSLGLNMLAVLSLRLRQFTDQIEDLSLKEVPARLADYLVTLSGEQKNTGVVTLPVSKGQLAGLLGTISETLSRIFSRMTQKGLISVDGRIIHLLDYEGIRHISEGGKLMD